MGLTLLTDSAISITPRGPELFVAWTSALPAGTWWQVYVDTVLFGSGQARSCVVPYDGSPVRIDVGSVASLAESTTDFASSLTSLPSQRAKLTWQGGSYLKATIAGYRIVSLSGYGSGGYGLGGYGGTVLDTVPAYLGGVNLGGYGLGGYGSGGYGATATGYSWTSQRLARGSYTLAVVPFDAAGNVQGTPATVAVTIAAPPRPPSGLSYTYSASTHKATLSWTRSLL